MKQRRQVAEQQVEGEEEDAAMGLAGIGVVPEPRAVRPLAHLGEVGGGIVGDEEETGEVMPRRGPEIGEEIGEERGDRDDGGKREREARPPARLRDRRGRRLP